MQSSTSGTATLAAEQTLTPQELEQGHSYLEQTQTGLAGALKGLSEAQWKFKPAADCWSIAEIVEHVIFVHERVLGPLRDQLAGAPAPPEATDYKLIDAIVINQFPNRLTKFKAPEFAEPTGRYAHAEASEGLAKNYERLKEYLTSRPDLRSHAIEARPLKAVSNGAYEYMDGYQWILAAAAHTERHTKQILEVKADAAFPER